MNFTFSALCDILCNSFSICRTEEFSGCGDYYYKEIKSSKWEDRAVRVLSESLDVLDGKITHFTIQNKKKLISQSLKEYAYRNIPYSDATELCKNMRWIIVLG